ncbi:MAG: Crp/Fnr family transcriptional regulator [Archangiaceae bacterium]|nr:Crp/Fnr family transcriptional regulator [Archangiaceae bacterium]
MQEPPSDRPGPRFLYPADEAERRRQLIAFGNLPVLETASAATVELLLSRAEFKSYARGQVLVSVGDAPRHFFVLLSGAVRAMLRQADGLEFTPVIFRAPVQFADLAGLAGAPGYGSSLEAISAAIAVAVPIADLRQALDSDHALCRKWLDSVVHQFSEAIQVRREQFFDDGTARAARLLLSFAEATSEADAETERWVPFALSYAGIAKQLGCTRRNAIRVMKELEARGLVQGTEGGWLLDRVGLRSPLEHGVMLVHPLRR